MNLCVVAAPARRNSFQFSVCALVRFCSSFFLSRFFPLAVHRDAAHSFTYVTFYYISFIFVPLAHKTNSKSLSPVVCSISILRRSILPLFLRSFLSSIMPVFPELAHSHSHSLVTINQPVSEEEELKHNPDTDFYPIRLVMYSCLPFG